MSRPLNSVSPEDSLYGILGSKLGVEEFGGSMVTFGQQQASTAEGINRTG